MAGGIGWSKNGMGKSRRSRSRASTPSRFFRCCKIHRAGFSEKRPSRVLPTMTEMTVMLLILLSAERKKAVTGAHCFSADARLSVQRTLFERSIVPAFNREDGGWKYIR